MPRVNGGRGLKLKEGRPNQLMRVGSPPVQGVD